jgi:Uma2 family endonuclease
MNNTVLKEEYFTYADYAEWDSAENKRYELIYGEIYEMAGASQVHQEISAAIFNQFYNFLKGKPCKVYYAPLDVRLFAEEDASDDTVVQPDIAVICDHTKWAKERNSYKGAPSLIVEILSPSNKAHDKVLKFNLYKDAGVKEYWIVDPQFRVVNVNTLVDKEYRTVIYREKDTVQTSVLDGCAINLDGIFGEQSEPAIQDFTHLSR